MRIVKKKIFTENGELMEVEDEKLNDLIQL